MHTLQKKLTFYKAPSSRLTQKNIEQFRAAVYDYFDAHGRNFPWRETSDPYEILVSEVMLQQTQTYRVLPKYKAFLDLFPTAAALAAASLHDVLAAWQGLGYNRRGLALKRAAEVVVADFAGVMPTDPATLLLLPGIGPYTASAVATFAFNRPEIFIETNIRTVFIHTFFHKRTAVHDRDLLPLIAKTLDKTNPRIWYYALMDYGVALKKMIPNPNRKSSHYTKQSKFEGSDRQVRGAIIRLLTRHGRARREELPLLLDKDQGRVDKIVAQLIKDDLLQESNGVIFIR